MKPVMNSNGTVQIPQSRYITAFNNKLIMGGGAESLQNTQNQVYYSDSGTPFSWGTTGINTLNAFSKEPINGLGAYSQNLLNLSFTSFLIVSKRDGLFVWDGNTSDGAKQLYYSFGFAGPRAFSLTDFGPVFISRSNAFFIVGNDIKPIGDEVKTILQSLNDVQLHRVHCTYQNRIMKIMYPSVNSGDPDSDLELWLELRPEFGQVQKYWSGPHSLTGAYAQDTSLTFGTSRDVRASCSGVKIYQRDTGNANVSSNIARKIVISRLGMNADHFLKSIKWIYLALKIAGNETFTLTLDAEDGSSQLILSDSVLSSNGLRQLNQYSNTSRFLGRVNTLTIDQASQTPISIFDVSLIYDVLKRRTLRY